MSSATPQAAGPSPDLSGLIYRKLMPLLIAAYIIAFIDRTNIGLAKAHLEADLGISAAAYGLGAGLFFLAYSACEIPSNLILHRVGARRWIARIMITWGLLSAAMAFVQGTTSFYVLRVLLGAAEAGLFPGVMLYLTYWFGREQRARANGLFLLAVCIANIVGAPLSGALLGLEGLLGQHGWQWMFALEGLPAVALAVVVYKKLPDRPADARWLTAEQAGELTERLAAEEHEAVESSGTRSLAAIFKDRQILLTAAVYFTHQIAVYSLTYFLPGIIGTWGKMSDFTIGLLTALPWVAAAVGALVVPRYVTSTSTFRRTLSCGLVAMAAGLVIAAVSGPVVALAGFCLTAFWFFVVQSVLFAIPAARTGGVALAGSLAMVNTIGILGGFLGPYVMGLLEESTGSPLSGLWFVIALAAAGSLLSLALRPQPGRVDAPVAERVGS